MRIVVHAKPRSKEERIDKIGDHEFVVSIKEPPIQGRANEAIIRVVAGFFRIPHSEVRIVSGWTGRRKILEIG